MGELLSSAEIFREWALKLFGEKFLFIFYFRKLILIFLQSTLFWCKFMKANMITQAFLSSWGYFLLDISFCEVDYFEIKIPQTLCRTAEWIDVF